MHLQLQSQICFKNLTKDQNGIQCLIELKLLKVMEKEIASMVKKTKFNSFKQSKK